MSPVATMTILTARLRLDAQTQHDAAALLRYELRNRTDFAPHGPLRKDEAFTPEAGERRVQDQLQEVAEGRAVRWVVRLREHQEEIIAHVAFTQIVRGVRHGTSLGYGLDAAHRGRGYMTEALQAAIPHLFETQNLHRVEAGHRPDNEASARVLHRLGFVREGLAKEYLYLNGAWTDQVLNALTNPAWRAPG